MPRFRRPPALVLFLSFAALGLAATPDSRVRELLKQVQTSTSRASRMRLLHQLARTARDDSALAAEAMARVFGKGLYGVPRDPARARRYLERAAELGSPAARRYLARRSPSPTPPPTVAEIVMEPPPPPPPVVHRIKDGSPPRGFDSPLVDLKKTRKIRVFSSPHCPPCRAFEPVIRAYCAGRSDLELEILDITTPAGDMEARGHDVQATPTTLFQDQSGNTLTRILGFRSAREITELLGTSSS